MAADLNSCVTRNLLAHAQPSARVACCSAMEVNTLASKHGVDHAVKPVFSQWYSDTAAQLFQQGDITNAEQAFRNALLIDPSSVHARNDLGNLLKFRGHLKEAKECYHEAIRQRPNLAVAWNNLGCVNLDEGNAQVRTHLRQEAHIGEIVH